MIGIQPGYLPLKTSCQCAFLDPLTKHSPPCPKTDEKNILKMCSSTGIQLEMLALKASALTNELHHLPLNTG